MIDQDEMLTTRATATQLVVEYSKRVPATSTALRPLLTLPMIDDEDLMVFIGTRVVEAVLQLKDISQDAKLGLVDLCMCFVENEGHRLGMTDNHMPITIH